MNTKKQYFFFMPYLKYEPLVFIFTELKNIFENLKHKIQLEFEYVGSLKVNEVLSLNMKERYTYYTIVRKIQLVVSPLDTIFINPKMRNMQIGKC